MSKMVRMRSPNGESEKVVSIQNASDMEQHLGWERVALVNVKDGVESMTSQEVIDAAKKLKAKAPVEDGESDEADENALPEEEMTPEEIRAANKS